MTKFTEDGKAVCPRHGLLQEQGKDYRLRKKKRKYGHAIVPACIACDRDFYKRSPATEEDKKRWAKARRERIERDGLKPMICVHHGHIPIDLVGVQQQCKLCQRDYYQKNRQAMLDAAKARDEKRKLVRKAMNSLECEKHGALTNENINAIGKCLLCQREYGLQYDRKNQKRIRNRKKNYYWKNRDTFLRQSKEKSKRYVANLTDSVVKGYLRRCGWDLNYISPKLIELKRATVKIKRIVNEAKENTNG